MGNPAPSDNVVLRHAVEQIQRCLLRPPEFACCRSVEMCPKPFLELAMHMGQLRLYGRQCAVGHRNEDHVAKCDRLIDCAGPCKRAKARNKILQFLWMT